MLHSIDLFARLVAGELARLSGGGLGGGRFRRGADDLKGIPELPNEGIGEPSDQCQSFSLQHLFDITAVEITHANTEFAQQVDHQSGAVLQRSQENVPDQETHLSILGCGGCGGTRLIVHQGHFAKEIARPKFGQQTPFILLDQFGDDDFSLDDDVESVAVLAFLENVTASFVGLELDGLLQGMQFRGAHPVEQLADLYDSYEIHAIIKLKTAQSAENATAALFHLCRPEDFRQVI